MNFADFMLCTKCWLTDSSHYTKSENIRAFCWGFFFLIELSYTYFPPENDGHIVSAKEPHGKNKAIIN